MHQKLLEYFSRSKISLATFVGCFYHILFLLSINQVQHWSKHSSSFQSCEVKNQCIVHDSYFYCHDV